jgi:hypothetical protein
MEKTTTIFHEDGRQREMEVNEAARLIGYGQAGAGKGWSFVKPPPLNWERETPKYRASRDVHPAPRARYRDEPPFSTISDNDCWQYAEREIKAHEEISTREWPHPSFRALNYSAGRVLEFFTTRTKSRLARSPWSGDRIRLDDGLSFDLITFDVSPPQAQTKPQAVDLRPAS